MSLSLCHFSKKVQISLHKLICYTHQYNHRNHNRLNEYCSTMKITIINYSNLSPPFILEISDFASIWVLSCMNFLLMMKDFPIAPIPSPPTIWPWLEPYTCCMGGLRFFNERLSSLYCWPSSILFGAWPPLFE